MNIDSGKHYKHDNMSVQSSCAVQGCWFFCDKTCSQGWFLTRSTVHSQTRSLRLGLVLIKYTDIKI